MEINSDVKDLITLFTFIFVTLLLALKIPHSGDRGGEEN
jgi:hypothetical protein